MWCKERDGLCNKANLSFERTTIVTPETLAGMQTSQTILELHKYKETDLWLFRLYLYQLLGSSVIYSAHC